MGNKDKNKILGMLIDKIGLGFATSIGKLQNSPTKNSKELMARLKMFKN